MVRSYEATRYYLGVFLWAKFMELRQNFLRVYENEAGTVTILANEDVDSAQQITIQSITIHIDDLRAVAKALIAIADERIGDE